MAKKKNRGKKKNKASLGQSPKSPKKKGKGKKGKGKKGNGKRSAAKTVQKEINKGVGLAEGLAPELLGPDATGLDRLEPTRVAETQDAIDRAKEQSLSATQQSPELAFAIEEMKSRLGGFTTPEEEALRARALEGVNAQLQASMRSAAGANLGRNLRGGAATQNFMPGLRTAIQQRRGLENDIMAQQIAERGRRLTEFTNTVSDRDARLFDQGGAALDRETALITGDRDRNTAIDSFNAAQQSNEIAAKIAARGTGVGLLQDEKARREAAKQAAEALKINQSQFDQLLNFGG